MDYDLRGFIAKTLGGTLWGVSEQWDAKFKDITDDLISKLRDEGFEIVPIKVLSDDKEEREAWRTLAADTVRFFVGKDEITPEKYDDHVANVVSAIIDGYKNLRFK